jgi:hypothetical protein
VSESRRGCAHCLRARHNYSQLFAAALKVQYTAKFERCSQSLALQHLHLQCTNGSTPFRLTHRTHRWRRTQAWRRRRIQTATRNLRGCSRSVGFDPAPRSCCRSGRCDRQPSARETSGYAVTYRSVTPTPLVPADKEGEPGNWQGTERPLTCRPCNRMRASAEWARP